MKKVLKKIWHEIDPIVELGIYVGCAFVISKLVNISFVTAMAIVYTYFALNVLRIFVIIMRDKKK